MMSKRRSLAFLAAKSRPEEEEKAQHYTIILPPIMFTFNFEHRSYHPRFPCQRSPQEESFGSQNLAGFDPTLLKPPWIQLDEW